MGDNRAVPDAAPGTVRLVDLDMIKRYSLAIRQEAAPAEEVLAVLDATRDQVLAAMAPPPPPPPPPAPPRRRARPTP